MERRECTELPSGPLTPPSQDKRFQLRDNLDIHCIPEVEAGVCLQQLGFACRAVECPELAGCQLGLSGLRVPHGSAVLLVPAGIPAVIPGLRACVQEAQAVKAGRSCTDQIQSFLTDEETEAQRAEEACPRSHSESAADSGLNQTFLTLKFGLVLSSGCHRASPSACCLCHSSGSASSEDWPWG